MKEEITNNPNNNPNDNPDIDVYEGCLKGCMVIIVIIILCIFLLKSCFESIDREPVKQGDWNFDGEVDTKDLDTYIKWKNKQDDE
ncbi:hypothetical protein MKZ17_10965 [Solibacillus sp. FSL R7-0682]|uniref:hypothetical protein n=1 Tax=Solibacillus sp. FSL R7-0682 TaxID=2921690 RepID=UPI0030F6E614